jgi:translation elongation factor EF-G
VAYREAITKAAEVDYTHKKQSGGSGQVTAASVTVMIVTDTSTVTTVTLFKATTSAVSVLAALLEMLQQLLLPVELLVSEHVVISLL